MKNESIVLFDGDNVTLEEVIGYAQDNDIELDPTDLDKMDEIANEIVQINYGELHNDIETLSKEIDNDIVVFATNRLWNGVRKGYKVINSLNDIFKVISQDIDEIILLIEDGELVLEGRHHDGVNSYTMRVLKDDIEEDDIETADNWDAVSLPIGSLDVVRKYYGVDVEEVGV